MAWYLRRARPGLDLATSVLSAGLTYAPWLAVGLLVWGAIRLWGPGWRTAGVLTGAMVVVVPLVAALGTRLDLAFLHAAASPDDWMERIVDRLPVALLLYTAVVAVGLAAGQWRKAREGQAQVALLTKALAGARQIRAEDTRLLVSTGRARTSVQIAAVEYFTSAGNYVVVAWQGREGLIRDTLQSLDDRLDARLFVRIHRSTLVNLAHVAAIKPLSDGSWRLTTQGGAELMISRTYRDRVLERLGRPA